jgi:SulP family sulfate permease
MDDPNEIVIDFKDSRVADQSTIEVLNKITERHAKVVKTVYIGRSAERVREDSDAKHFRTCKNRK